MATKSKKGNVLPKAVWVTLYNLYPDEPRAYLSGVEDRPWDKRYDAPITKYADNIKYVLQPSLAGVAVTNKMVDAAQKAIARPYPDNQEYGVTDDDMRKAIGAALKHAATNKP